MVMRAATPAAPVKPESFTVYAGNGEIVGRSNAAGEITSGITGKIDYETGFVKSSAMRVLP